MTDWVHALARDWGYWIRRTEAEASLVHGTLGRIAEEGPEGAAIRSAYAAGRNIPITDVPKDVAKFHRIWLTLTTDLKEIVYIDYKLRTPVARKYRWMGLSKNKYYKLRTRALVELERQLTLDSGT